jgi:hypothetical protein
VGRRAAIIAIAAIAVGVGVAGGPKGLGLWGADEATSIEECLRDFPAGFHSTLSSEQARFVSVAEIAAASRPLCAVLIREDHGTVSREEARELWVDTVRANPEAWKPLCNLAVDADFESAGESLRFVTNRERSAYRDALCGSVYVGDNGARFTAALAPREAGVYIPFCAAGIQAELVAAGASATLTRHQLRTIGRRACREAIRAGAFDVSELAAGRDPNVDEAAFCRILTRVALEVMRASESASGGC